MAPGKRGRKKRIIVPSAPLVDQLKEKHNSIAEQAHSDQADQADQAEISVSDGTQAAVGKFSEVAHLIKNLSYHYSTLVMYEDSSIPGIMRRKYTAGTRELTTEDILACADHGDHFVIVTKDGKKYKVSKT
jgi:uncharacterized protein YlxP (DUF503 family)